MFWRMPGRSCLPAILLLILPLASLHGQSDRTQPDRSFAGHNEDFVRQFSPSDASPVGIRTHGGPPHSPLPRPDTFGFPQLVRAAGTIFSGTVTAITLPPATQKHAIETVSITFHVERPIRGAIPGEELNISQWIGLWSSGQRYRVGERVLLFLYPPSKLGLTSSVAGPLGRFQIDARGYVSLSAEHLSAFGGDPLLAGKPLVSFSDFAEAVQQATAQASGRDPAGIEKYKQ